MTTNTYIVGEVVVLTDTIRDPVTLALVDDSSEALAVYDPTGSVSHPAIVHVSTGVYKAQVTVAVSGWWEYVFSSTLTAAGAKRGWFYVSPVP